MSLKLQVTGLTTERHDNTLFNNMSFVVNAGEALEIVGPNGSGKTTLLRMLCGLSQPSEGGIRWCGQLLADCYQDYRLDLIYLAHQPAVKGGLTVAENLKLLAALGGRRSACSIEAAIQQMGLQTLQNSLVGRLSAGQQRRVALAKLLLVKASVWILDEPFVALDRAAMEMMEGLIAAQTAQGGMVILTSHQAFKLPGVLQHDITLGSAALGS